MNKYKQGKSEYKIESRMVILEQALRSKKHLSSVITLPNKNFELERAILKSTPYRCQIQCFENDPKTYRQALKVKPRGVKLLNEDIFKHEFKHSYPDFVWLDLCNSFTKETVNKIIGFVRQHMFVHGSTLAITLNRKRGTAEKKLNYAQYKNYRDYKNKGFAKHIAGFIRTYDGSKITVRSFSYTCLDINKFSSMIVFIFKIQ